MPSVPVKNNFSVIPSVVQQPRANADAFGASTWKMAGDLSENMAKASKITKENEEWTSRQVATTKARETINALTPDITARYAQLKLDNQGSNATTEAFQKFQEGVKAQVSNATGNLSPYASQLVTSEMGDTIFKFGVDWGGYYVGQNEKARIDSINVENDRLAQDLVIGGDKLDSAGIPLSQQLKQNIASINRGADSNVLGQKYKDVVGTAVVKNVQSLMYADPVKASSNLEQYKDTLAPDVFGELSTAVAKSAIEKAQDEQAYQVVYGGKDFQTAYDDLNKSEWAQKAGAVTEEDFKDAIDAKANGKEHDGLVMEGNSVVSAISPLADAVKKGDMQAIANYQPPAGSSPLAAKTAIRYRNHLLASSVGNGVSDAGSQTFEVRLSRMSDAELISQNPDDWIGKMKPEAFNRWLTKWNGARNGDFSALMPERQLNDIIINAFVMAGVKDPSNEQMAIVRVMVQDTVDAAKRDNKPIDTEYIKKVVNQSALRMGKSLNRDKIVDFNTQATSDLIQSDAAIAVELQDKGINPTQSNIDKAREGAIRNRAVLELKSAGLEANDKSVNALQEAIRLGEYSAIVPDDVKTALTNKLVESGKTPTPYNIRRLYQLSVVQKYQPVSPEERAQKKRERAIKEYEQFEKNRRNLRNLFGMK